MWKWIKAGLLFLLLASAVFVQAGIAAEAGKGSGPSAEAQMEILSLEAKRVFDGGSLFWRWSVRYKNQLPTESPPDLALHGQIEFDGKWKSVKDVELPPMGPGEEGSAESSFPMVPEISRFKAQIYSKSEHKYVSDEKVIDLPALQSRPAARPDPGKK